MNRICCLTGGFFIISIIALAASASPALAQIPDPEVPLPPNVEAELQERALEMVNEISNRRRLHLLFENPQSPEHGVRKSFVNVGAGNLSFIQRDLVRLDGIPLIAGRVYDSNIGGADFGPGWKLAMSEAIRHERDQTYVYTDANNSPYRLKFQGTELIPDGAGLPGFTSGDHMGTEIILRDARLTRTFSRLREQFVLTRVEDGHGNAVELDYERGQLSALRSANGRALEIERDDTNRIVSISDDAGRQIEYHYHPDGTLRSSSLLTGEVLEYRYDAQQRLTMLIDPREVPVLTARYQAGKVAEVSVLGTSYRFEYQAGRTTVTDPRGVAAIFEQNEAGITKAVTDNTGVVTHLALDDGRPTGYAVNNLDLAAFVYTPSGQLEQVTNYGGYGATSETRFQYEPSGQLQSVSENGQAIARFESDDRGRLSHVWTVGDGDFALQWSGNGQPRLVEWGNTTITIGSDPYGRITRFAHNEDDIRLVYDDHDRVTAIESPQMGSAAYGYDAGKFRTSAGYDQGYLMAYEYDAAGNLKGLARERADGARQEDIYVVGERNELKKIVSTTQPEFVFEYDILGRATRVTAADRVLVFAYDEQSRVTRATLDDRVVLESDYDASAYDLAHYQDGYTFRTRATQRPGSGIIGGLTETAYTRPEYSPYQMVVFDEEMNRFALRPSEDGYPERLVFDGFARRRLALVPQGFPAALGGPVGFDKPSNALFVPPEYASVNCELCNDVTYLGHTLKIDDTTSAILEVDQVANFNSSAVVLGCSVLHPEDPLYNHVIYFGDNQNVGAGLPTPSFFANHAYSSTGVYNASATVECTCGAFGVSWASALASVCSGEVHIAD